MSEQVVEARSEVVDASVIDTTLVKVEPTKVLPLNYEEAFKRYTPEEQKEIMELSQSIDVRKKDHVMHYAGTVLKETFDQCGELLKKERGSAADQSVIAMVSELSKQAKDSYEDFNMLIKVKEPNIIQKAFLALKTGRPWSETRTQMVQETAVTSYDLLMKLKDSESEWLDVLTRVNAQITESAQSDIATGTMLEKYIIAGMFALERIKKDVDEAEELMNLTGMQTDAYEYDELKHGYELFEVKMNKLEQSRQMYRLSVAQLGLTKRSNENMQITITSEMQHSMTLMGQQIRNAMMDAEQQGVMDGYKAITHLNDELIQRVSENIGLTAQESEEMIYTAFYNIESAKTAITAVINCCQAIKKTSEEKLPQMKANTAALNALFGELESYMSSMKTSDISAPTNVSTNENGSEKLEF